MPPGILELFVDSDYADGKLGTFLRWTRWGGCDGVPAPPESGPKDRAQSAFSKRYRPFQKLKDAAENRREIQFWISDPTDLIDKEDIRKSGRGFLHFSRVEVLDQFHHKEGVDRLEYRFPCVREIETDDDDVVPTSRLTIGSGEAGQSRFRFRLELAFPVPLPVGGSGISSMDAGPRAIGLGGLYTSSPNSTDIMATPRRFLTGYANQTKKSVYGDAKRRLGTVGLWWSSTSNNEHFIPYRHRNLGASSRALMHELGFSVGPHEDNEVKTHNIELVSEQRDVDVFQYSVICRRTVSSPVTGAEKKTIDLRVQIGAYLDVGDQFRTEAEMRCLVSWDDIKARLDQLNALDSADDAARAEAEKPLWLKPEMDIRLRWTSALRLRGDLPPKPSTRDVEGVPIFPYGGLPDAAAQMIEARDGLLATQSQPQSFIPDFSSKNSRTKKADFIAFVREVTPCFALGGQMTWTVGNASSMPAGLGITVETAKTDHNGLALAQEIEPPSAPVQQAKIEPVSWNGEALKSKLRAAISLRARFPSFNVQGQENGSFHFHLKFVQDSRAEAETDDGGAIYFRIANDTDKAAADDFIHFEGRLGSLDFESLSNKRGLLIEPSNNHQFDKSSLTLRRRARALPDPRGGPFMDVELELAILIGQVRPVTVDIAHGERGRERADLLIDESGAILDEATSQLKQTNFNLKIKERLRDTQDRQLTVILQERTSGKDRHTKNFTVIGEAPFSVYRFTRLPLAALGTGEFADIATYDSDRREWLFLKTTDNYHLTYQAAATGESADKPGRLEIHDVPEGEFNQPHPPLHEDSTPALIKSHVVDSRFGPATDLWVKPSDLERNYVLPEHAGFRLFRLRGDFGLGVQLAGMRGELLYALAFGVDAARRAPGARQPRVAEIEALVGRMVMEEANKQTGHTAERWRILRDAFQARMERLEVWTLDPSRTDPFAGAVFDRELTFALRETALLKPPVALEDDWTPPPPKEGRLNPPRLKPRYELKEGERDIGFAGGALWPLESRSYLEALLDQPASTGGRLERFALSPLGGSGDQTAHFLNGNVTIISETREGRLQKHRIEIKGRIGAFWHHAKHVVVYERTTAASAQFTPVKDSGSRTARPVLRKVDEYVEILEPVRRYPDFPNQPARGCGFLEEVRFNSRIIRVNSAWGADLGDVGWQVPLWNRAEARLRPNVYPFPDVAFVTRGEGDDEHPLAAQECLDVANLFFFADAQSARVTSDTDAWPSRRGVDFSPLGDPKTYKDEVDPDSVGSSSSENKRRPAASRMVPGMRRFVWRLAPGPTRTMLNAGRSAKPVFAGLHSVTFMRSVDPAGSGKSEVLEALVKRREIPVIDENGMGAPWVPGGAGTQPAALKDFTDALKIVVANPTKGNLQALKDQADLLKANPKLFDQLDTYFGGGQQPLSGKIEGKLREIQSEPAIKALVDFDSKACKRTEDRLRLMLDRKKRMMIEVIRQAQLEVTETLDRGNWPTSTDELRGLINNTLNRELEEVLADTRLDLGNAFDGVETARAVVRDWQADAEEALKRARGRVDGFRTAYNDGKPWSRNRIERAQQALRAEIDAVEQEAQAALDELRQRLAGEIDAVAAMLTTKIARTLAHSLAAGPQFKEGLGEVSGALDHYTDSARQVLRSVLDSGPESLGEKVRAFEENANAKIKKRWPKPDPNKVLAEKAVASTVSAWESVKNAAEDANGGLDKVKEIKDTALATINGAIKKARKQAKTLETNARNAVSDAAGTAQDLVDLGVEGLSGDLSTIGSKFASAKTQVLELAVETLLDLEYPELLDQMVADVHAGLTAGIFSIERAAQHGLGAADRWLLGVRGALEGASFDVSKTLRAEVKKHVLTPAVNALLAPLPEPWPDINNDLKAQIRKQVALLSELAQDAVNNGALELGEVLGEAAKICEQLAGFKQAIWDKVRENLQAVKDHFEAELHKQLDGLLGTSWDSDTVKLVKEIKRLSALAEGTVNEIGEGVEYAHAYVDRAVELAGAVTDGNLKAFPNNALKLYSALTQSPELAMLKANMDRMRSYYDAASDIIETSKAKMLFEKLGDALKAIGLDLPFNKIADEFKFDDDLLKDWDLTDMFGEFGGLDLSDLLPDVGMPRGIAEYVTVTHDFDKKAVRAWVQIVVGVPVPGRKKLFSIGPFTLYFRDSLLDGFVRVEASKDTDEVQSADKAITHTNIEAVVGGQVMVTLQQVQVVYTKDKGLDFVFDPKGIKIHRNFQFIQDTLGSIFGDTFGGLNLIKESGIPVGLEHEFAIPPISLMYGTSGVSNLAISNRFQLRAYPDFIIANTFNLSKRELPFLFSIFIIGGTGYIRVDTSYRPFDGQLMVAVEAGVGGSAAFGFAFGPVAGGVFITLSVVLRYQKLIGQGAGGSGLTVSLVLVIAGTVSLWGMVHIYLGLMLSISYHESGKVDGLGSLRVELRISRWFKLKYSTSVRYQLRGGRSTTQVTSSTETGGKYKEIADKAKALNGARKQL
jgi:hypothetical protein